MAKNKNSNVEQPCVPTTEEPMTETPVTVTEPATVIETEPAVETTPVTAIATVAPSTETTLISKLSADNTPLFLATYQDALVEVAAEMPDRRAVDRVLDALPDDAAEKLTAIIRRSMGKRKGVHSDDDRPEFTELRVYHGTGNDPNRPENMIPGQFYLSTRESVGKIFQGTVLMVYKGRTMWGDKNAGDAVRGMPICQSMDRKVGSQYGLCETCAYRPWRDGKPQRCSDDVVVYMLSQDLKDIALVRFAKTSEGSGRQLIKAVKRADVPWSKWFAITAEAQTSATDKSQRWYVINATPVSSDKEDDVYVPESLHDYCSMMCTVLEANIYYPTMANIYRQAKKALALAAGGQPAGGGPVAGDPNNPDYSVIDEAPDGMASPPDVTNL